MRQSGCFSPLPFAEMRNYQLRSTIVKIQDHLTAEDRDRFHFYFGNHVSRTIRDDSTLAGTLDLINELFERDQINERDFNLLIDAFDTIQCIDAASLLRGHSSRRLSRRAFRSSRTSKTNGSRRSRRDVVVLGDAVAERFARFAA